MVMLMLFAMESGLKLVLCVHIFFFFSSRRRHTRLQGDWSSDVCSSDLRARTRFVISTAAGLNRAGSMRLPLKGALRFSGTPALHVGAAKAVQSPLNIL